MSDPSPLPWANYAPSLSPADQLRLREGAEFAKRLAADDAARAAAGKVPMVAITGFTVIDDPNRPEGRVVQAGQEFTVSSFDLDRYAGRAIPK